jgi:hypothetical protein
MSAPPAPLANTSSRGGSSSASTPGARPNAFPVAMPIAVTIGTDKGWLKDSVLGVAASKLDARRTRDVNRRFVEFVSSRGGGLAPRARLTMLLESFGLENHEGMGNFAAFVGVVAQAVFAPPLQNDLILERVFAMHEDLKAGEVASKWAGAAAGLLRQEAKHASARKAVGVTHTEVNKFSLLDPLDRKLAAVEEVLRSPKWQLLRRVDFDQLVLELTLLVLEFERVETAQWALLNLRARPDQSMPKASLLSAAKVDKVKHVIETLPDDMKQCAVPEFLGLA